MTVTDLVTVAISSKNATNFRYIYNSKSLINTYHSIIVSSSQFLAFSTKSLFGYYYYYSNSIKLRTSIYIPVKDGIYYILYNTLPFVNLLTLDGGDKSENRLQRMRK